EKPTARNAEKPHAVAQTKGRSFRSALSDAVCAKRLFRSDGPADEQSHREAVAVRVLVDRVAVGRPARDALLVVDRVVPEALPERDDRQQFVERERELGHRRLLLALVEAIAGLVDQVVEVDRLAARELLL